MKLSKNPTENSVNQRFSHLLQIYSGITGQIYRSNVEKPRKALYGLSYPVTFGFGFLAWCKAAWYGYAFFSGVMALYALIITRPNGRRKAGGEDKVKSGVK
jgi:hypothetical protein